MKAMMKMPNHEIQNEPTTVRQLRRITRDARLLAVRFDSSPYRSCALGREQRSKTGDEEKGGGLGFGRDTIR
jgi:hypothetical protein